MNGRLERFADVPSLTRAAAAAVVSAAERAVSEHGRFLLCLSGGQTPKSLYELLASEENLPRIDWQKTHVVFGDERCVAPDHEASNYRMARTALLERVSIPPDNVLRIEGELEPELAAQAYEARLQALLGIASGGAPAQPLDVVLLGLGQDAHTASLFPHSVDPPGRWAHERRPVATGVAGIARVTLTPIVLNAARSVLFLVAGRDKAAPLAQVLEGPRDPLEFPAQRIQPTGELVWLVDAAAAAALSPAQLSRR